MARRWGDERWLGDALRDPLLVGLAVGIALGAFFGWRRSQPLDNPWQRGVIGVLAAVGALLVGFLAAPIHGLTGLPGLVVWGALALAAGVSGNAWARRGMGDAVGTP